MFSFQNFVPHRSDMDTFEQSIPNSVFTLAVYIVIFIIMLNVIMGIIVDKFAELRNRKVREMEQTALFGDFKKIGN